MPTVLKSLVLAVRGSGRLRKVLRVLTLAALAGCATIVIIAATRARLEAPAPSLLLRDRNGRFLAEVGADAGGDFGYWPLPEIPQRVAAATLVVEDRRFRSHPGVDPLAIARALVQNVSTRRRVSGASTVAMQVARMQEPGSRNWCRKAVEGVTALLLTGRYGRDAVLEHYLRIAPYGNRIHGIACASRRYFDKPVEDLSWAETAFLAALPQSPGRMNPYRERGRRAAIDRGRRILDLLLAEGALPPADHAVAVAQIEALDVPPRERRPESAIHAVLRLDRELRDPALRAALASQGPVTTTLDLDLQEQVERAASSRVALWESRGAGNAAVIVVKKTTREVLAWVGSTGYFDGARAGALDFTSVPRSPGSILKPFLYARALDQRLITPATILDDLQRGPGGIANADDQYLGPLLPRAALANSRNVPAADLLQRMGIGAGGALFRELGLDEGEAPARHYGLGLAIGGMPVRLEKLVRAYTVLAGDGCLADLVWYKSQPRTAPRRIVSEDTAREITLFLSDPMARLPSFPRMGSAEYPYPVAVKTGTSSNRRDAWAVAWSDFYLVGVWVGHPSSRPMNHLSGFNSAASLAQDIMNRLHPGEQSGLQDLSFPPPRGFRPCRICALTGKIAGEACSPVFLEWFHPGEEPVDPCPAHLRMAVDARNGLLATARTPRRCMEVRTFLALGPRYAAWAASAGLPFPPSDASPLGETGDRDSCTTVQTVQAAQTVQPVQLVQSSQPAEASDYSSWKGSPPTSKDLSSMGSFLDGTDQSSLSSSPGDTHRMRGGEVPAATLDTQVSKHDLRSRAPSGSRARPTARGLALREARIRITSPEPGARLMRDPETPPELSTLALTAVVDPPAPQIVWYVDGHPFKVSDHPYTARWPLRSGSHVVEARLPNTTLASRPVRIDVQ